MSRKTASNKQDSNKTSSGSATGLYPFITSRRQLFFHSSFVITSIVQWVIFKKLYPFADFFNDSFTYIGAARDHAEMSFRPLGYSRFLAFVHGFGSSDLFINTVQYMMIQTSSLLFFYCILYLFRPGKAAAWVLFSFLLLNPMNLYVANLVSSDALFFSCSLLWATVLLCMLHKPNWLLMFVHAALVIILFHVRFTAIYYPLVSMMAIWITRSPVYFRIIGIALSFFLVAVYVQKTKEKAFELTGTAVFSPFGGWQLANNALHMYPHIKNDPADFPSDEAREIDSLAMAILKPSNPFDYKPPELSAEHMWNTKGPLKQFLFHYIEKNKLPDYFEGWCAVGPIFSDYGTYLIKTHPKAFCTYFLWPNTKAYFLPPLEKWGNYNDNRDTVPPIISEYFHYTSSKVSSASLHLIVLSPYPSLFCASSVLFLVLSIVYIIRRSPPKQDPLFNKTLQFVWLLTIVHAGFSIFSGPIVMRYQQFPQASIFTLLVLLTGKLFLRTAR